MQALCTSNSRSVCTQNKKHKTCLVHDLKFKLTCMLKFICIHTYAWKAASSLKHLNLTANKKTKTGGKKPLVNV